MDLWIKQVKITHRTALVSYNNLQWASQPLPLAYPLCCSVKHPWSQWVSNFSIHYFHSSLLVAASFPWQPGLSLDGDLGFFESSCLTQSASVYIIFFLPNISEIPILSVTIAPIVLICWFPYDDLLYNTTTDPTPCASLPSMSSFFQVVLHSREHQAQFSPLICKALAKTRPSHSAIHLDLTSSPLTSLSLWAIQPCHWQICLSHSLQKESCFWVCPWGYHLPEFSQGLKNCPLTHYL